MTSPVNCFVDYFDKVITIFEVIMVVLHQGLRALSITLELEPKKVKDIVRCSRFVTFGDIKRYVLNVSNFIGRRNKEYE